MVVLGLVIVLPAGKPNSCGTDQRERGRFGICVAAEARTMGRGRSAFLSYLRSHFLHGYSRAAAARCPPGDSRSSVALRWQSESDLPRQSHCVSTFCSFSTASLRPRSPIFNSFPMLCNSVRRSVCCYSIGSSSMLSHDSFSSTVSHCSSAVCRRSSTTCNSEVQPCFPLLFISILFFVGTCSSFVGSLSSFLISEIFGMLL